MKLAIKLTSFFFLITSVIQAQKLLELIDAEKAGIDFRNTIKESGKYNHVIWDYVYNGAGVAIGDINNDGLADIFFTGNQVADRLYLNKGSFQFENITANLRSNSPRFWSAGVTMVDVNADGWLDIYVCRFEPSNNKSERRNLLYINNHNLTFTEKAEEYGLADTGYSVQSAFFDFDNDGDLDCFVVNQPPSNNIEKLNNRTSASVCTEYSNKLYRNNSPIGARGAFEDVTLAAGLESCSYGLGLAIADLNNDGWQDIYVSNDYFVSDFAFINQKDGTFLNKDKSLFKHESLYSMGVDIADFNNDGLADVFTADMSAADHYRNKANMASMNTERFDEIVKSFNHQYMFNALQLNRGNGNFSEIAQLAGVANTDWSWSSLFIDIDNDSNKDLFVTNGIKRDIRFVDGMNKTRDMMATGQIKLSEIINNIPSQKLPNYAFQNKKDLHFENKSAEWGFDQPSFSNGMAYGDLDNDGDLDLVINNVDDLPFIYKNNSTQNYLRIKLEGEKNNTFGYGAKALIYYQKASSGAAAVAGLGAFELNPTRGFLSSSEPILHFGLGNIQKIDSLVIIWNDKSRSKLTNVKANQVLKVKKDGLKDLTTFNGATILKFSNLIFQEKEIIEITHKESTHNDFAKEVLLPNKLSEIGPALSVADANGDGLDDIFVGGGKGQNSRLLFQNTDGGFRTETFDDASQEKTKALFFDANKDGRLDLYVACGSNEFEPNSPDLQDNFYLNIKGKFKLDSTALPKMLMTTGAVAISDIDKNDKQLLFVGGLMQQQKYPFPAESYLSRFDKGKMQSNAPIGGLGAIRDALWTDFDNDGDQDLIAVGEWTNIQILENIDGELVKKNIPSLEKTTGFWHSIKAKDFDNDGDEDYVLGNLGLNNKFKKDAKKKFHVYSADFDENGVNDVVLAKVSEKGTLLPVRGRECSSQQMPFIAQKIKTFDEFAKSTLNEIYTTEKLSTALHYEVNEMGSIYVENLGYGNFQYKLLPILAQFSVITDMLIEDFDHDGKQDILAVGNKYEAEVETARYDASLGVFLKGDGKGDFKALEVNESGFVVNGNSRNLAKINIKGTNYVIVGINNGKFKFFEIR